MALAVNAGGLCLVSECKPEGNVDIEEKKSFYTLEEVYSYGWISKKNLKSSAELVNSRNSVSIDVLDDEVSAKIRVLQLNV